MKENSDGNDTNVGSIGNSIEEDITKINTYVELVLKKDYCNCNELNTILGKHCDGSKNVAYAMQHILSDYKRVLKENKELKNDYENLSNSVVVKNYYIENSIPVQKVKDKIEEEKLPLVIVGGRRNKRTLEYGIKLGRRQALQELLEKE